MKTRKIEVARGIYDGWVSGNVGSALESLDPEVVWEAIADAPDAGTDELVLRCVQGRFPVITGVEFGHQQSKITFPIGCRVELDLLLDLLELRLGLLDFALPPGDLCRHLAQLAFES